MASKKVPWIAFVVLLIVGTAIVISQRRINQRLQAALLEAQRTSSDVHSRAEKLETSVKAFGRAADSSSLKAVDSAAASAGLGAEKQPGDDSFFSKMTPIEKLGNRGRATPRDALATQLWAARGGDISLESKLLTLGPKARAEYEQKIAQVPADIREHYNTPEELMAYALSGSPRPIASAEVLDETQIDSDTVTLRASWQHEDSSDVVTNTVYLHRSDDGWQLVIGPSSVDRAIAYLSNQTVPSLKSTH
jgi:hypothetical protein